MAVFAIPNPKKSIQVDFPIERVKLSVLNISLENDKYNFAVIKIPDGVERINPVK